MYGYRVIQIEKQDYFAHRLAFLLMTGSLPPDFIDHINGARDDNRWENLRPCTATENMQNLKLAKKSNQSSGLLGAFWHKNAKKWRAQIRFNGHIKHLGYFSNAADAHAAYLDAKRKHHSFCEI